MTEMEENRQGELERWLGLRSTITMPVWQEQDSTSHPRASVVLESLGLQRPELSHRHMTGLLQTEPASRCEFGLRNTDKAYCQNQRLGLGPYMKPSFEGKKDAGPGNRQDLASLILGHYPHNMYWSDWRGYAAVTNTTKISLPKTQTYFLCYMSIVGAGRSVHHSHLGLRVMEQPPLWALPVAVPERKERVLKGLLLANKFLARE